MVVTQEQKSVLLRYVPHAEEIIASGNLYELELEIDVQITDIGMGNDFELNEVGRQLQKLYDEVYSQN